MNGYERLLERFVEESRMILADNLVGVYLHGSAVMGCFRADKSDIDLLVVVHHAVDRGTKRRYMDMVVELNRQAPAKGIELSVVRAAVCKPFVYPTPFELHFSVTHLGWYQSDPDGYIDRMQGTDKDLAAHCTILYHRGRVLYGEAVKAVFDEVSRADYMDSIWFDVENAEEDVAENPMYIILNLCRVLAYKREGLILSKREGGAWGSDHVKEPQYAALIASALAEYQNGESAVYSVETVRAFAREMLEQIKG